MNMNRQLNMLMAQMGETSVSPMSRKYSRIVKEVAHILKEEQAYSDYSTEKLAAQIRRPVEDVRLFFEGKLSDMLLAEKIAFVLECAIYVTVEGRPSSRR